MEQSPKNLRMEAQALFMDEHYTEACSAYDELFNKLGPDPPLSLEICRDYTNYGKCLLLSADEDLDDDENVDSNLEMAKAALENALQRYQYIDQDGSFDDELIEVHELLAEVASKRGDIEESKNQHEMASEIKLVKLKEEQEEK